MPLDLAGIVRILKRIHLFHNVEETRLEAAARYVEAIKLSAGQVIFKQDDNPDYFYIIAEGKVRISRAFSRGGTPFQLGFLEEDDYLGEEMLQGDWARRITAEAETNVTLLRINVQQFQAMIEIIPQLGARLQFILDSYKLMVQTSHTFSWRGDDEAILFISRRHALFLILTLLPPLIFGFLSIPVLVLFAISSQMLLAFVLSVLAVIVFALWFLWSYIDWTNDYYIITSQRVISQERVIFFYESRQEYPLQTIQSTTVNTSQWGRWFGYGNVAIRTYYGTLLFRNINHPNQVMTLIQQEQLRAQFAQRKMDVNEIGSFLDRRIRHGLQRPALPEVRKPPPPPDPMREFLVSMFHQRYQLGKTIIYRTTFYLMLKKTVIPTLLLFSLLILFIVSAVNNFPIFSGSVTCGFTFLVGLVAFFWWLYEYIDWHNDRYLITSEQVVDVNKKPLGQEERLAAPIKNILSIEYKQKGLIRLLLNFGTVYISVGDRQLTFDDVFRPSEVQRELFHRLQEVSANEKKAQAEADKQRLGDWFASFTDWQRHGKPDTDMPPGGSKSGF